MAAAGYDVEEVDWGSEEEYVVGEEAGGAPAPPVGGSSASSASSSAHAPPVGGSSSGSGGILPGKGGEHSTVHRTRGDRGQLQIIGEFDRSKADLVKFVSWQGIIVGNSDGDMSWVDHGDDRSAFVSALAPPVGGLPDHRAFVAGRITNVSNVEHIDTIEMADMRRLSVFRVGLWRPVSTFQAITLAVFVASNSSLASPVGESTMEEAIAGVDKGAKLAGDSSARFVFMFDPEFSGLDDLRSLQRAFILAAASRKRHFDAVCEHVVEGRLRATVLCCRRYGNVTGALAPAPGQAPPVGETPGAKNFLGTQRIVSKAFRDRCMSVWFGTSSVKSDYYMQRVQDRNRSLGHRPEKRRPGVEWDEV